MSEQKDWIVFNGIAFNAAHYRKGKKEEFVSEQAHHKLSKEAVNEVWNLIKGEEKKSSTEDKKADV